MVRLEDEAYGVSIYDDLEGFLGEPVSLAAVYAVLERLERRLLLRTTIAAPLAVQGGHSKRLFEITTTGRSFLKHEHSSVTRLWQALPSRLISRQR